MAVRSEIFYKMAEMYSEFFERASIVAGNIGRYLATMDSEIILNSPFKVFNENQLNRLAEIFTKTKQRTKEEVALMLDYGINTLKHFLLTGEVPDDRLKMYSIQIVKAFVEEKNQLLNKLPDSRLPQEIRDDVIDKIVSMREDLGVISALMQGINVGVARNPILNRILQEGMKGIKDYADIGFDIYEDLTEEGKYKMIVASLLSGKAMGLTGILLDALHIIDKLAAKGVEFEDNNFVGRFNTISNTIKPRPAPRL